MVRRIHPFAGRCSCDPVSYSESASWCHHVVGLPNCCRSRQRASKSCGGPLDDWLPSSLVSAWNHPDCEVSGCPVAPRYFDVNMFEWRALCRRMLRSGLGKKVHPTSYLSHLSGGAVAAPKNLDRDTFIGDRRSRNGTERLIGKCHLPSVQGDADGVEACTCLFARPSFLGSRVSPPLSPTLEDKLPAPRLDLCCRSTSTISVRLVPTPHTLERLSTLY